ncbi:MAG: T9SS type A sorting domain-containing protein [Bacteroidota bacterium]|nr:T9SS type A sorting domain-containing protein [Bacteroidota bacterium]
MKNICLFIFSIMLLLLVSMSGKAQTTYYFEYDASGNRLTRSILQLKSAGIENKDTLANQLKTFEDMIGNRPVKIYPNPTKGLLKVEIPFTEESSATISVLTMQGALAKKLKVSGTFTEIDMRSQPPGIYLMIISIGELSSEWKIIKD